MKRHLLGFLSWAAALSLLPILLLGAVRPTLSAPRYAPSANPQNACATTLVSMNSAGVEGNGDSEYAAISRDGRYVAFVSEATNLVAGGTNGRRHIFVHDRQTGETTLASVDSDGVQGNYDSDFPSISGNGRYVAFASWSTKLVPQGTNGQRHIFVHDRRARETSLVSVHSTGAQGNNDCEDPSISADGRYVVFESEATNLADVRGSGQANIFIHDRQRQQTALISMNASGVIGNAPAENPHISADGHYVEFESYATNLVPGGTNGKTQIFVHDRHTGEKTVVSVNSSGVQGNQDSENSPLSGDGRHVAIYSHATNLVAGGTSGDAMVYVHDRDAGETTLVSVDANGEQANNNAYSPSISTGGRYVAFASRATNLAPGGTNGKSQVYVHDRQTARTTLVSVDAHGVQANFNAYSPSISGDGRYVAFDSFATNLVPGGTNGFSQVFVRDRWACTYLAHVLR